jgi:flagellin-specific chaperone FliS
MTRIHDLHELRKVWSNTKDPTVRLMIEKAGNKIRKESGIIKSMRERLVKEHRQGNTQNVKDIHDFIKNKLKYQNL